MRSFEDGGIDFGGERFRCAGFHGMDGIGKGHSMDEETGPLRQRIKAEEIFLSEGSIRVISKSRTSKTEAKRAPREGP